MNYITKMMAAVVLAIAPFSSVFAEEYTRGTVKTIDVEGQRLTIIHEELKNLDMPAMTMVFRVADEAMLDKVTEGQAIEFIADRVGGKITVVEIRQP